MPITAIPTPNTNQFSIWAWEEGGECPVLEFLERLEKDSNSDAARLLYLFARTAEHRHPNNEQQCKHLDDGIWEFKASNGARVLWFYDEGRIIVCTHGFVKKKQKTPPEEIRRAKRIRKKYFEEKNDEQ